MGVFADSTLQIFLSLYHGSMIGVFIFDYIIRNSVRAFQQGVKWNFVSNIALGVLCVSCLFFACMNSTCNLVISANLRCLL